MNEVSKSGFARIPTGVAGLDTILNGGFLKGGIYIVQGLPGTGKTTLANQICFLHAASGGRVLYATLLAEYHGRMMQHMSGMSFFDVSKIPDQLTYLNGFGTLRTGGYPDLRNMLRREITSRKASIMILDGFATAQRTSPREQDFNEFVHDLQAVAIATECTMFLLTSAEGIRETPEYTIVDGILELSDRLIGWSSESTLQVIKFRGSSYLRGRHAFRITDNGLVVYPRIEALLAQPTCPDPGSAEVLSSGAARLDAMLGGGLPAASTTMIMGPSGVGKTTLGLQFIAGCSEAEPGLIFGFYEAPGRIRTKADEVSPPLGGLLDAGIVEILWQPPTEGLLDAYGERLLENVRRRGVRRLLIDGLDAFQGAAVEPGRLNQYLTALMNELRALGVTSIYTLVVPDIVPSQMRAPVGELTVPPDNLIMMRYVEAHSQLHRLISVVKVGTRNFDHRLYRFTTTSQGLQIEQTSDNAGAVMDAAAKQVTDGSLAVLGSAAGPGE